MRKRKCGWKSRSLLVFEFISSNKYGAVANYLVVSCICHVIATHLTCILSILLVATTICPCTPIYVHVSLTYCTFNIAYYKYPSPHPPPNTFFVGALQVLAPLPASMEEMQRDVICVSNGITHPHISWTINYQVVHGSATIDGWTFVPFTTSNQVNISFLDTWQSAASGRLSSNGSKNENITIHCRHRLANGEYNYSAPLMFRRM